MLNKEVLDIAGKEKRQRAKHEERSEKHRELGGDYAAERNGALHGKHALHDRLMTKQCPEKSHTDDDEQPFFINESFHGAHNTCFSGGAP